VVDLTVELTTPACPLKDTIERDVRAALAALPGFKDLRLTFTADVARATPQQNAAANNPLPRVKHIVAIGAGKGGVGKSTVAVNVAVGLGRCGAKTALLDGDIYGPSAPTLLGLGQEPPRTTGGNLLVPYDRHGIGAMTIGQLVEPDKPLIWRGPMAHGAFRQLALQTDWGDRDYLIIDLPPGTGDVPLTMSQLLPLTGAVVVCTPQKVAQDDAVRALNMFRQLQIPVLGVVENMSWFIGDDGKEYDIFGRGGAEKMAARMGVPFLGAIPISMALRANSDAGAPLRNFDDPALSSHLDRVVRKLAGQVSVQALTAKTPTLSVS
jgi:ATP-binding protein involved in chromosome partitioning